METNKTQPVRILYDYQTFHIQMFGGISRYFCELVKRMSGTVCNVSVAFSMNRYLRDIPNVHFIPVAKRPFKLFEGLFRCINRLCSVRSLKKGGFDLFHPTYYDPYFLDCLHGKPFVLTIHDMTHERYPQFFAPDDMTQANKRLLAQKARRIIAISECTKRDIIDCLGVPEQKIDVIYHGIAPQPLARLNPEGFPDNYILFVGERRGYKNFDLTVGAFCRILQKYPDLNLVMTGRPLSKREKQLFLSMGITDRTTVMGGIDDIRLAQLYRNARLFIYPSLYEGFGIPVLEAFSQRCPVVLSNASCFPEVAGNAACYFEPDSVDSCVSAIDKVLSDSAYRNELADRGIERLKLFSWDETARRTAQTYLKALK